MEGEDATDTLPEKIKRMSREGGHVDVELTDGSTHRAYLIGDYELEEPEWSGDVGSFWARLEFPDPKDPGNLEEDQYPTQMGEITAKVTDNGWEEIELLTDVQRVKDDELERWEGIRLGEIESIETKEDEES
ncbi:hypothetical protein [Halorubrum sp. Atlit-26R]|uniref:hypothetical protein n=1 Tax=Halorubrum sp. Atlit-26R TaxID=2282128 RepID=UPI000EF1CB4E|nr:hypothetical protein [Halorubrum sp. Atlit-26R]RLM68616.1 hypothetical protein DVK07_10880 [Halorubrum sp. Atlit-26R]